MLKGELPRTWDRVFPWLPWILALVVVGSVLWVTRSFSALPPDTADQLVLARHLAAGDGYVTSFVFAHPGLLESVERVPETHGLLWPVVHAGFFWLGSVDAFWTRVIGLLCVAGAALFAFYMALNTSGRVAGAVAFLLVLTSPNLVAFALLGHDDVSLLFFMALVFALMQRALRSGKVEDFALVGISAAAALLAKPLALVLPVVLFVLWFHRARFGWKGVAARACVVVLPLSLAFAAYLARNVAAHGSLGFRYGALEWLHKSVNLEAMYALYDGTPAMSEILRALGPIRILDLIGFQLAFFAESFARITPLATWGNPLTAQLGEFIVPAFLPVLGLLATLMLLRTHRDLAVVFLLWGVTMVAFLCGVFYFDLRYFSTIVLMSAVSLGIVSQQAWNSAKEGTSRPLMIAGLVLTAATVVLSGLQLASSVKSLAGIDTRRLVCGPSLDWIAENTPVDARVIALNPMFVTWYAERQAVMWPSGGIRPLRAVASHYGAEWLLASTATERAETSRFVNELARTGGGGFLEPQHSAAGCVVFKVRRPKARG